MRCVRDTIPFSSSATGFRACGRPPALQGLVHADALLTPPDAVCDDGARLSREMLAVQVGQRWGGQAAGPCMYAGC